MNSVEWGEYKLGDLFEITGTKSLDSNAVTFVDIGINYVGRTFDNNGVQGKIDRQAFEPNEPYTITSSVIGYKYVKYQEEPYYCSQNINKLIHKDILKQWNKKIAYYIITNIQKYVSQYDGIYGGYKLEDLKKHVIKLPTRNGAIDFDFMESFIAELEAHQLAELEAHQLAELEGYLSVTGLRDYTLTEEELTILQDYNSIIWKEYRYNDLFELRPTKTMLTKADLSADGYVPVFSSESTNNGIIGLTNRDPEFIVDAQSPYYIIFGDHTRNFNIAKESFAVTDNVKVLLPTIDISLNSILFIISAWKKCVIDKGYARHWSIAKDIKFKLPTRNGAIDFDYMEAFITALQKLAIKDVVEYSNRQNAAMKTAVNRVKSQI